MDGASLRFLEPVGVWVVAAAVVLLGATVLAYRGRRGAALLVLRVAAVLLVLLLLLDPVLSFVNERTRPARVAVLVDGSLSMSFPFPEAADSAAAEPPSRADRLRGVLAGDLPRRLAARAALDVYRFGADAEATTLDERGDLAPRDDRTDLARALARGVGTERRTTGAIVLFSDGAGNVGADPRDEARRLGVPVIAVGVGGEGPVTDLSVAEVEAANVAYVDNRVPVRAKLRARGAAAGDVTVYLSEGDAVLDSARVSLPGGGAERDVDLDYRPTREGLHRYRVWTRAVPGEISEDNNAHLFVVRVLREKIDVLLLAGRPGFELRYVKRALESDVSLAVETVILSAAEFPGRLGKGGPPVPGSWADIAARDVIVLLDCAPAALGGARQDDLARFVRERGGALLVMGPAESFDPAGGALAEILPAPPLRVRPRTGAILPSLTEIGRNHPVTQLEPEPERNVSRWREMPPLDSAPAFGPPRPDAKVLVRGALDGADRDELVLVATRAEGKGRVLAIAGAPYWRWDLYLWGTGRSGDALRRLLSRSVRWLVARDDFKPVMIRPVKNLFDGAESVVLEGQVWDDDYRPVPGADVRATVRGPMGTPDEKAREISLVDLAGGRYRGSLPGLPPGDYRIEGRARREGAELGADDSEMTVAPYRMELEDPAPDFEMLREIARESGGAFVTLAQAGEIPDLLDPRPITDRSVRELPFLESPVLFLLLLALLGAEWGLRRRRGLP